MATDASVDQNKKSTDQLKEQFDKFSKFGNSAKTTMTTSACNKMFRECKLTVAPGNKYTSTDVDIAFSKVKQQNKKEINFDEFKRLLDELTKKKDGLSVDELTERLSTGSGPVPQGTTKVVKSAVVEHLTDTTQYTGSHRERFDEKGKGRGIVGRHDTPDTSGYVHGYKDKGSYESKVAK